MSSSLEPQHWLLTSFEPFAGRKENNSRLVLSEFQKAVGESPNPSELPFIFHYFDLPVHYDACFEILQKEVEALQERGVKLAGILSIGEGSEEFKLETQANNLDDVSEISDNRGVRRENQKIFPDLPSHEVLPLRFPFESFGRIRTSKNPGFYICNHLAARLSRKYHASNELGYFGFVHVPKVGSGGMFTADLCAAILLNGFRKLASDQSSPKATST